MLVGALLNFNKSEKVGKLFRVATLPGKTLNLRNFEKKFGTQFLHL